MEFNFIQDIRAPQIDSKCVPESSRNLHPLGAEEERVSLMVGKIQIFSVGQDGRRSCHTLHFFR